MVKKAASVGDLCYLFTCAGDHHPGSPDAWYPTAVFDAGASLIRRGNLSSDRSSGSDATAYTTRYTSDDGLDLQLCVSKLLERRLRPDQDASTPASLSSLLPSHPEARSLLPPPSLISSAAACTSAHQPPPPPQPLTRQQQQQQHASAFVQQHHHQHHPAASPTAAACAAPHSPGNASSTSISSEGSHGSSTFSARDAGAAAAAMLAPVPHLLDPSDLLSGPLPDAPHAVSPSPPSPSPTEAAAPCRPPPARSQSARLLPATIRTSGSTSSLYGMTSEGGGSGGRSGGGSAAPAAARHSPRIVDRVRAILGDDSAVCSSSASSASDAAPAPQRRLDGSTSAPCSPPSWSVAAAAATAAAVAAGWPVQQRPRPRCCAVLVPPPRANGGSSGGGGSSGFDEESSDSDCEDVTRAIINAAAAWGPSSAPTLRRWSLERSQTLPMSSLGLDAGGAFLPMGSRRQQRTPSSCSLQEEDSGGSSVVSGGCGGSAALRGPSGPLVRNRSSYHLTDVQAGAELLLRLNHARQTLDFVKRQAASFAALDKAEMDVWEALDTLTDLHSAAALKGGVGGCATGGGSAPDAMSPVERAFQTAELCRLSHPQLDWLHLVGLLHGLGQLLAHRSWGSQPQWAVSGWETFPVGCRHSPHLPGSEFFSANPDRRRRLLNTPCGAYAQHCGLTNIYMAWGAPEYLYLVLALNDTALPPEALFLVRHQAFRAVHPAGDGRRGGVAGGGGSAAAGATAAPAAGTVDTYAQLLSPDDRRMLPLLAEFQALVRHRAPLPSSPSAGSPSVSHLLPAASCPLPSSVSHHATAAGAAAAAAASRQRPAAVAHLGHGAASHQQAAAASRQLLLAGALQGAERRAYYDGLITKYLGAGSLSW